MQLAIDVEGGRVELDCARGNLIGPVLLDGEGRFSANGTFEAYRAGPQPADAASAARAARYVGQLRSDGVMTLSIATDGAGAPLVYTLRKDVRIKLIRCL